MTDTMHIARTGPASAVCCARVVLSYEGPGKDEICRTTPVFSWVEAQAEMARDIWGADMSGRAYHGEQDKSWASTMRAAISGDTSLYCGLLDDIGHSVRLMARRALTRARLGDADVEDIVQETLLAIHLKRHTWDGGDWLAPWVAGIARHKIADALRRRGVRPLVPIHDFEDTLAAPEAPDPHVRSDIERLMRPLTPRQREIVRAVSLEGEPIAETARRLSMSEVAVRVTLHRALKALAEIWRTSQVTGPGPQVSRAAGARVRLGA